MGLIFKPKTFLTSKLIFCIPKNINRGLYYFICIYIESKKHCGIWILHLMYKYSYFYFKFNKFKENQNTRNNMFSA